MKRYKKGEIATLLTLGLVLVGTVVTLASSYFVGQRKTNIASNPRAATQCSWEDWDCATASCKPGDINCLCGKMGKSFCAPGDGRSEFGGAGNVCVPNKWDTTWGCWGVPSSSNPAEPPPADEAPGVAPEDGSAPPGGNTGNAAPGGGGKAIRNGTCYNYDDCANDCVKNAINRKEIDANGWYCSSDPHGSNVSLSGGRCCYPGVNPNFNPSPDGPPAPVEGALNGECYFDPSETPAYSCDDGLTCNSEHICEATRQASAVSEGYLGGECIYGIGENPPYFCYGLLKCDEGICKSPTSVIPAQNCRACSVRAGKENCLVKWTDSSGSCNSNFEVNRTEDCSSTSGCPLGGIRSCTDADYSVLADNQCGGADGFCGPKQKKWQKPATTICTADQVNSKFKCKNDSSCDSTATTPLLSETGVLGSYKILFIENSSNDKTIQIGAISISRFLAAADYLTPNVKLKPREYYEFDYSKYCGWWFVTNVEGFLSYNTSIDNYQNTAFKSLNLPCNSYRIIDLE